MDYTNDPDGGGAYGPGNEHLNAHDLEQLETMYAHLDSTNTATLSAAPTKFGLREVGRPVAQPGGDQGVGDTMADWGRAIRQDARGRPNVFVRQLPDGRKVITHVLWALEAKGTEAH